MFLAQALPFYCRPSGRGFLQRLFGEDGGYGGFVATCGEAQTAAGVRSSRFLPKTARRAPQALEAGAFWVHRPKSLLIGSLFILLRRVLAVFLPLGGGGWAGGFGGLS